MKKIYTTLTWALLALFAVSLTSCDDDDEIARTLEGTWSGDMYASAYWYDNYYDASYTEVCFLRDPYRYSSGTGYWVDHYSYSPWGGYDYIANHINWTVNFGTITIHFVEDGESVDIYDYALDDSYFTGYIRTYNGVRKQFRLRHVSSPNWGSYYWGYDDYYYSNGNHLGMEKAKAKAPSVEKPKRIFRERE